MAQVVSAVGYGQNPGDKQDVTKIHILSRSSPSNTKTLVRFLSASGWAGSEKETIQGPKEAFDRLYLGQMNI